MNFGQGWRTPGVVEVSYELTLPISFLIEYLDAQLPEYVADSLEHPDPSDLFENALRAAGWPSAKALLEDPDLARLALDLFGHDLLLQWFGDGPPEEPGFVLNTVMAPLRREGVPVFQGSARRSGVAVRFQDV
jgi:hypothetical protein